MNVFPIRLMIECRVLVQVLLSNTFLVLYSTVATPKVLGIYLMQCMDISNTSVRKIIYFCFQTGTDKEGKNCYFSGQTKELCFVIYHVQGLFHI